MTDKSRDKPEILAPAGDLVCLQAALEAGCDAVYFGVKGFNMRAAAGNFTPGDLPEVAARCHKRGVSAYLALNIVIYEDELAEMRATLQAAKDAEIDAVICWDTSVMRACRDIGLPIHISTQASISNSQGILHYHREFGAKRFVLARECSLEHIKAIRQNLKAELGTKADEIEIEIFAHGAMCVSVSGRCFLSEYTFGRSGNRGACIQPCRRQYRIVDVEGECEYELGTDYVLSPKDLCTIPFIEQLLDGRVDSLKIEGRNRNADYVDVVVAAYRKAVDFWAHHRDDPDFGDCLAELKTQLMERVEAVYHRGFSDGFFMGKPVDEWTHFHGNKATRSKDFVGLVVNYYAKVGVAEVKVQSYEFSLGDELLFQGPTSGVVRCTAESIQVEHKCVDHARQGTHVAIKVPARVRVNDQVYVYRITE